MDMIASELLAFPPGANLNCFEDDESYHNSVRVHVANLSKLLQEQSANLIIHGPELLAVLDPAINSLSYLAVLHSLVLPGLAASAPRDLILEKLVLFLTTFDARQCRYAKSHLSDIIFAAGDGYKLPPSAAVEVLATAILRLDPTGSLLTSFHILLAKLAYTTNVIEPALPVIDKDIVFYPGMADYGEPTYLCDLTLPPPVYISRETGLTNLLKPSMVLEYNFLRGMIYCSRRDWAKAYDAFEQVIAFPTREGGTSKIMVESYKKWVLVSLLCKGKLVDPPSYTGASANKFYGSLGKPYQSIAAQFVAGNVEALKAEVEKNNQLWSEDGNTGLIQEVLAAYQKWRVLGLEQVYSKISLPEIRQQTTSAETGKVLESDRDVETLIQNMIISGMLSGVIEKNDDGMSFLTFLPTSTLLSEEDFATELASTALRLKQLHSFFKTTRERLGTSKEYIKHVIKEEKRTDKNDLDPTLAFDTQVDDEDLMGGVVATG
ncbi:hypothetical protein F5B19DRAFT_167217 [Rostrohypoxylon terebratum]|nr:hypothetical protein F5B19DRAFT_167217 [Rostrohypoxylon terebratum]